MATAKQNMRTACSKDTLECMFFFFKPCHMRVENVDVISGKSALVQYG